MAEAYDIVVAGAGHNSLVATANLAKAGFRTLVVEARSLVGGNTATEELTLPGFLHDTCSTAHNLIQASPTLRRNELELDAYGLEYLHPDPVVHVPFPDGIWITQWREVDRTSEGVDRWDQIKSQVSSENLACLRRYAPNLTEETILATVIKSPLDLERFNAHNWHGSCHGGDLGPAQSGKLRPVPGWAQHRLPIPGLYQTGATTHPGGSVSAGPGYYAAKVMLADLGTSLETVLATTVG